MVELELSRYTPVLHFIGLKSYRHYFLADCHTDMEHQHNYCVQMCFLGAKYAKNAFVPAAGAYSIATVGLKGSTSKGNELRKRMGVEGRQRKGTE